MKGLILFVLALFLGGILIPIGLLFGIIYRTINGGLNNYLEKCALSIDQHGNVICGDMFNVTLRKQNGYDYGNPDETISSATGKNLVSGKLTILGKLFNSILDKVDAGHSIKSIDKTESND